MSPIKVCFIPPKGLENRMDKGNMVMSLAHLLTRYTSLTSASEYTLAVQHQAMKYRRFVILDNGACEGQMLSNEALADRASLIEASELVLPDVLRNSDSTFEVATDYLKKYYVDTMKYMAVVQGTTEQELKDLVERYADVPEISTLGLPRLLLAQLQQLSIRIDLANWIFDRFGKRFEIHLLGASGVWVKEALYASKYAEHVRSIDTSLPYNYGLAGVRIDNTVAVIDRKPDYFTAHHDATGLTTIFYNEEVYKSWCKGTR